MHLAQASPPARLVPTSWSPDGTTLVATIYSASSELGPSYPATIALVTSGHRVPLATAEGAQILGGTERELRPIESAFRVRRDVS